MTMPDTRHGGAVVAYELSLTEGEARVDFCQIEHPLWEVIYLAVPRAYRRRGLARSVMSKLCRRADQQGATLALTVTPDMDEVETGAPDAVALTAFYASLGFDDVSLTNEDYDMIRKPFAALSDPRPSSPDSDRRG